MTSRAPLVLKIPFLALLGELFRVKLAVVRKGGRGAGYHGSPPIFLGKKIVLKVGWGTPLADKIRQTSFDSFPNSMAVNVLLL